MATNLKLSKQQLSQIKNESASFFPDGSIKIVKEKYRKILIIDLKKLYQCNQCTKMEYLDIINQYESIGYTYYFNCMPYLYFYKKKSIFEIMKDFLKRK